jgi:colanic acid biosynthesis glycosyl transferase WcaI
MTRLIVLNRYFFPDHSATSQLLSDLMFHLASTGVDAHVITSRQLYNDPQRQLSERETIRGVSIHRVATTKFGRSGLLGRSVDYLSFYRSADRMMRNFLKPGDILVAMTDPPLSSIPAMRAARRRGAHLINWLQDIYPEIAVELGVPFLKGPIASSICFWRDRSLKSAAFNVVVGQIMADKLADRGLGPNRIKVIHNWADDREIAPVSHPDNRLRRLWGLDGKFVVGYSGNLGRAHEFDTILAASEALRNDPRIVFLFIGSGHRIDELARMVKSRGLEPSFHFVPYQDRAVLRQSLGVPDLHWLSLKPKLEGLIVPSKFYGIAAAGRPTLAITSAHGEIAKLVRDFDCGLVIEPGDSELLAVTIRQLSDSPERLERMGRNARAMLDAHFTRDQAFQRWRAVLNEVDSSISLNIAESGRADRTL